MARMESGAPLPGLGRLFRFIFAAVLGKAFLLLYDAAARLRRGQA